MVTGWLSERFQPHWINYTWHRPLQTMNFSSKFYLFISTEKWPVEARIFSRDCAVLPGPIKVCTCVFLRITNKFPSLFYIPFRWEKQHTIFPPNKNPVWGRGSSSFVGFSTQAALLINWCILMISSPSSTALFAFHSSSSSRSISSTLSKPPALA